MLCVGATLPRGLAHVCTPQTRLSSCPYAHSARVRPPGVFCRANLYRPDGSQQLRQLQRQRSRRHLHYGHAQRGHGHHDVRTRLRRWLRRVVCDPDMRRECQRGGRGAHGRRDLHGYAIPSRALPATRAATAWRAARRAVAGAGLRLDRRPRVHPRVIFTPQTRRPSRFSPAPRVVARRANLCRRLGSH